MLFWLFTSANVHRIILIREYKIKWGKYNFDVPGIITPPYQNYIYV